MHRKVKEVMVLFLVMALSMGFFFMPASGMAGDDGKQTGGIKDLASYEGKDREQKLLQLAKTKKEILIYESEQSKDFSVMVKAFEKKYGLKINYYQATGEALLQRIIMEEKAGKLAADLVDVGGIQLTILKKEGYLIPFKSPELTKYPGATYDRDGYWAGHRLTIFVPMVNSNAIAASERPKNYEDLLDPKWKGKIAVEINDYDWFATLKKYWGQKGDQYFARLKMQELKPYDGHSTMTQLLTSGEIQIAFPGYLHHAVGAKYVKGAPVDWVNVDPVVVKPAGVGLLKSARNPAGALLFMDFLLSEEGQLILAKRGRTPALPSIETKPPGLLKKLNMISVDFDLMVKESDTWLRQWRDLIGLR